MTRKLPDGAKGLTLSVYRDAGSTYDCTLGGVSSKCTRLTLVGIIDDRDKPNLSTPTPVKELPKESRIFAPADDRPAVILRIRRQGGARLLYSIEPYQADGGTRWYMAGGNYASSCDSRLAELTGHQYGALSIHDRHEG